MKDLKILLYLTLLFVTLNSCNENMEKVKARIELWKLDTPFTDVNFMNCIKEGDSLRVGLFLKAGMSPNTETDSLFGTPLLWAVDSAHTKIVQLLLDNGVSLNNWARDLVLIQAASIGNLKIFKLLISTGEYIQDDLASALTIAASHGSDNIIRFLLNLGIEINVKDETGDTPLINAVSNGRVNTAELLLEEGADVNAGNNHGKTALMYGVTNDHSKLVELLLNFKADVNVHGRYDSTTAFLIAIDQNNIKIAKLLLAAKADINAQDSNGQTALMYAAGNVSVELVELLLKSGAKVNTRDKSNQTALSKIGREFVYAISRGKHIYEIEEHIRIIKTVLIYGADPNVELSNVGKTLLFKALQKYEYDNSFIDIINFLISKGADINRKYEDGKTALMIAVNEGKTSVIKLLISKGVNVNARDDNGKTALIHLASTQYKSRKSRYLATGIISENAQILFNAGAYVNITDADGRSALTYTAINGHYGMAKLLIENGAKINIIDKYEIPILGHAVGYMRSSSNYNINRLFPSKPNSALTGQFITKIRFQLSGNFECNSSIVQILLEYGAKVNIAKGDGSSFPLLLWASRHGCDRTYSLLEKYGTRE